MILLSKFVELGDADRVTLGWNFAGINEYALASSFIFVSYAEYIFSKWVNIQPRAT